MWFCWQEIHSRRAERFGNFVPILGCSVTERREISDRLRVPGEYLFALSFHTAAMESEYDQISLIFLDQPCMELFEPSCDVSPYMLMQEYHGLHSDLGAHLFDLATSHRKDGQMTQEDFILLKVQGIVSEYLCLPEAGPDWAAWPLSGRQCSKSLHPKRWMNTYLPL